MNRPPRVVLTPELAAIQERWLQVSHDRDKRDPIFENEFAAGFAALFAQLPLYGARNSVAKPKALISVLGLSWQPVALMAAWCQPQQMLMLGTEESFRPTPSGQSVISLVARVAGVPRDAISERRIVEPVETEIYREVRDFLRRTNLAPHDVFVDPTGGKKSMSASAALAGFVAGLKLVYVDYSEYREEGRIPVAGSEYARLLANSFEVMGDLELRDIFAAFNRSDFREAEHLAAKLAERLYEPREALCLQKLAQAYGLWDRFEFARARDTLAQAKDMIEQFADRGQWSWAGIVSERIDPNLEILAHLATLTEKPTSIGDGIELVSWYLAAAARLLAADKVSLGVLLTYAALERYVDLCLWVDFALEDEKPDYSAIGDRLDRKNYDKLGVELHGKKSYRARELEGPLMLFNGVQLLGALNPARLGISEDLSNANRVLGPIVSLARARNKCEYEHGLLPVLPDRTKAEEFRELVISIASSPLDDRAAFEALINLCSFPTLR